MKTQTILLVETKDVKVSKPVFGLVDFWNLERMRKVRSPRRNMN